MVSQDTSVNAYEKCTEEGQKKDGDIEIKFTGLRPGEKLYEELLIGNNVTGTCHPKIMTACEESLNWEEMEAVIKQLDTCCHDFDLECIKRILLETPTGYMPQEQEV